MKTLTRDQIKTVIEGVYIGKYTSQRLPFTLFEHTSNQLLRAVKNGWGELFNEITSPDFGLWQGFRDNIFFFAAGKTATELKELNGLIFNADGSRRPKRDFIEQALKVNRKYNVNYLETEYQTTVRLARSGKEWKTIKETEESFPFLEYVATMDENTRNSHASLNGVIRMSSDPFWLQYFPPLDWNCRCRHKKHRKASETDLKTIKFPKVDDVFTHNVGESRKLWTSKHPYFKTFKNPGTRDAAQKLVKQAQEKVSNEERGQV